VLELTSAAEATSPVEVGVKWMLGPLRSVVSVRIAVSDCAVVAAQDASVIATGPAVAVLAEDRVAALDAELERIAKVRLKAVHRLRRDGWSYDRIAAVSGLSKGRVAQLSKDPRSGK